MLNNEINYYAYSYFLIKKSLFTYFTKRFKLSVGTELILTNKNPIVNSI